MAKKLSHELIQPRAKRFVMGHQHQTNLKYKQRKGEEKLERNNIEPIAVDVEKWQENLYNDYNSWLKKMRATFEQDKLNGKPKPTNIDLFDTILVFYAGQSKYDPYDDQWQVYMFKSTRSLSVSVTDLKSDLSQESAVQAMGINVDGFDPNYGMHCTFGFSTAPATKGWLRTVGGAVIDYRDNGTWYHLGKENHFKLQYSSANVLGVPQFKGSPRKEVGEVVGFLKESFPLIKDNLSIKSFENCGPDKGLTQFVYIKCDGGFGLSQPDTKGTTQVCMLYGGGRHESPYLHTYYGKGGGSKDWKQITKNSPKLDWDNYDKAKIPYKGWCVGPVKLYTNNHALLTGRSLFNKTYKYTPEDIIYVTHPKDIPSEDGGGYDCAGNPWLPDDLNDIDSQLTGPIGGILEQEGKTFYLLGKETKNQLPKLYLFDLGQVGGGLKYSFIKDAVVYKQENCKWLKELPKYDLKLSSLEGEVDTNFYLLTMDKLDRPTKITEITQRKANEYLIKHFPTCNIARPDGQGNPNDNLKPDFGQGGGGNGGIGGSGQGGFFPEVNNPLPNPQVPPCIVGNSGASQTPVSEIILLQVPELKPTYEDTYDFPSATDQAKFFSSKPNAVLRKYSYLRKDNAIQIGSHVDDIHCYNYLMYRNKFNKWYYCFIMDKQYINEMTTRITIATDVIQTYLFDYTVGPCFVERCHVPRWKDDNTPTPEYEPEGLEFGEHIQESTIDLNEFPFQDTYIAVCSNPLGVIPSRSALKKAEEKVSEEGVDENA